MATTYANVPVAGRPYTISGPNKHTVTDVTVADNSEVITAAGLGLNCIYEASAQIRTGQTSDNAIYAKCTPVTGDTTTTLALFTADGTAATTSATTVVRVKAVGY